MNVNSYRASPSQLQASWAIERGADLWLTTEFMVPRERSPALVLEQVRVLESELELLRTRIIEREELGVPVQVVAEPNTGSSAVLGTVSDDPHSFRSAVDSHREAVTRGQAALAVDLLCADNEARARLTASRALFDATSLRRLAAALRDGSTLATDTQFLDFSEWLSQGFADEAAGSRSFWRDRQLLSSFELAPADAVSELRLPWALADDPDWAERVLAAWLRALHVRLGTPARLRLDRLLDYRSLGELGDVLGPLQIRVPTLVDFDVDDLTAMLLAERRLAEQHLAGFDLVSAREVTPTLVFEVGEADIASGDTPAGLYLRATRVGDHLQLYLRHGLAELGEVLLEATTGELFGNTSPGPRELEWQHRCGNGGASEPAADPISLLRELVEADPNAAAIVAKGQTWTRARLWARVERIAAGLRQLGVAPGDRVGVLLDKDHDAIATMFGVLYVGAVFVPLDGTWPLLRVAAVIEDASPRVIVGSREHAERHGLDAGLLLLDELEQPVDGPDRAAAAVGDAALGYILYTSGSTGRPKGVAVPRVALTRLANAFAASIYAEQPTQRRYTVNAPLTFDASIKQIVMLVLGGSLWLVDEELRRRPAALLRALQADAVDVLDCTPTHLRLLLDAGEREALSLPPTVLVGGESIDASLWQRMSEQATTRFVNVYGPTEATVVSTWSPVTSELRPGIGLPLPGCRVWIRDADGNPVATGATGELWIGGDRVAQGYAGRPELSAAVFVPAPDRHGVAYRSGDQARWLPEGRLGFCGRIDHQVKLRGHRVELGEIEAALAAHPGVANAAVIPTPTSSGELQITAFAEVPTRALGRDDLLPNGRPLVERTRLETDYLYKEIFVDESYAGYGIVVPESGLIFDVGANIGMFSLWAKHRWASARIHAYEPVGEVAEVYAANLQSFADVNLHPYGLSDSTGELEFVHYRNYSMMSGRADGADSDAERAVIRRQLENQVARGDGSRAELLAHLDDLLDGRFDAQAMRVEVRTLGQELAALGERNVDLLKIDVQRSELDVLRGLGAEGLARVQQIVMEVHDAAGTPTQGRVDEIIELLEDAGFEVRVEQDADLRGTDRFNLTAWRPDWRARVVDSAQRRTGCSSDELRDWLDERLPDYARPHHLRILDALPRTHSGKLDRPRLAELVHDAAPIGQRTQPANALEQRLAQIWASVLELDELGVTDSFFRLGGDSISGIRLQVVAREAGLAFELRDLFECQTIRELAVRTKLSDVTPRESLPAFALLDPAGLDLAGLDDAYPISGLQLGMLFHAELTGSPRTYHNVTAKRLRAPFEPEAFTLAWRQCVERHETLRTGFVLATAAGPLQLVHHRVDAVPEYLDWSASTPEQIREATDTLLDRELETAFELDRPPLVRLRLCKLPDQELLLFIAEHHAILDGLSLELLREELLARYKATLVGQTRAMTSLDCRPVHFVKHERSTLTMDLGPWREVMRGATPVRIGPRLSAKASREFSYRRAPVDPRLYAALRRRSEALGVHLKHVLLAAHARVLGAWVGNADVVTGLVLHGRPERRDADRMLGLFIHTLPVRLRVDDRRWSELIRDANREDRRVQDYRHLPLWVLRREFGASAGVPTFFNYVAFESSTPAFEVLDEHHVGVDVDVDLAVDFVADSSELTLLHQQPAAASSEINAAGLLAATITALEAAADPTDPQLPSIVPRAPAAALAIEREQARELARAPADCLDLVRAVVAEVLGIERPPTSATFQALGGHSLQAVEVVHRLRELTRAQLPLTGFLAASSLADLADLVASQTARRA